MNGPPPPPTSPLPLRPAPDGPAFAALVFLGLVLAVGWNAEVSMDNDSARDVAVAQHVVATGAYPHGPPITALGLRVGPWYTIALAGLCSWSDPRVLVAALVTLWALGVLLVWKLARNWVGDREAVVAATLFGFAHANAVSAAHLTHSPFAVPLGVGALVLVSSPRRAVRDVTFIASVALASLAVQCHPVWGLSLATVLLVFAVTRGDASPGLGFIAWLVFALSWVPEGLRGVFPFAEGASPPGVLGDLVQLPLLALFVAFTSWRRFSARSFAPRFAVLLATWFAQVGWVIAWTGRHPFAPPFTYLDRVWQLSPTPGQVEIGVSPLASVLDQLSLAPPGGGVVVALVSLSLVFLGLRRLSQASGDGPSRTGLVISLVHGAALAVLVVGIASGRLGAFPRYSVPVLPWLAVGVAAGGRSVASALVGLVGARKHVRWLAVVALGAGLLFPPSRGLAVSIAAPALGGWPAAVVVLAGAVSLPRPFRGEGATLEGIRTVRRTLAPWLDRGEAVPFARLHGGVDAVRTGDLLWGPARLFARAPLESARPGPHLRLVSVTRANADAVSLPGTPWAWQPFDPAVDTSRVEVRTAAGDAWATPLPVPVGPHHLLLPDIPWAPPPPTAGVTLTTLRRGGRDAALDHLCVYLEARPSDPWDEGRPDDVEVTLDGRPLPLVGAAGFAMRWLLFEAGPPVKDQRLEVRFRPSGPAEPPDVLGTLHGVDLIDVPGPQAGAVSRVACEGAVRAPITRRRE